MHAWVRTGALTCAYASSAVLTIALTYEVYRVDTVLRTIHGHVLLIPPTQGRVTRSQARRHRIDDPWRHQGRRNCLNSSML